MIKSLIHTIQQGVLKKAWKENVESPKKKFVSKNY